MPRRASPVLFWLRVTLFYLTSSLPLLVKVTQNQMMLRWAIPLQVPRLLLTTVNVYCWPKNVLESEDTFYGAFTQLRTCLPPIFSRELVLPVRLIIERLHPFGFQGEITARFWKANGCFICECSVYLCTKKINKLLLVYGTDDSNVGITLFRANDLSSPGMGATVWFGTTLWVIIFIVLEKEFGHTFFGKMVRWYDSYMF